MSIGANCVKTLQTIMSEKPVKSMRSMPHLKFYSKFRNNVPKHFPKKPGMVSGFFRKLFGDLGDVIASYILAVACFSKTFRYFPKYFKCGVLLKKFPGFCKEKKFVFFCSAQVRKMIVYKCRKIVNGRFQLFWPLLEGFRLDSGSARKVKKRPQR
jgi:hypothetical protein